MAASQLSFVLSLTPGAQTTEPETNKVKTGATVWKCRSLRLWAPSFTASSFVKLRFEFPSPLPLQPLLFQWGVQPFGVSRPHWKKRSCLGPHIKYTNTNEN